MICDGIRHCTDSADERCDCDETTFNCTLNNECVAPALQCDGFKDCTDGSDENNCEPSVGCSFNRSSNFDCGYFLYLAQPGSSGIGLRMFGLISYITSPDITINDNSCLAITAAYIGTKLNIRVASFDGEMYTVLYQGPWQFVEMT
ncbi:low-density lipoprotein receptor-related protein 12-like, partial [Ruditapes philippinarum]|uniref:low-density lipoprotein receptor-related protein 12-like n=1 Tax=Ruditapes philippinarum TaxID=129788 RepID=UPI00295B6184